MSRINVYHQARRFGGTIHGDDGTVFDIEFPNLLCASEFADEWQEEVTSSLREPVSFFNVPVVVQVSLKGAN